MKITKQKSSFILIVLVGILFPNEILPLTQKYFNSNNNDVKYNRGTYLIVLADESLKKVLIELVKQLILITIHF